METQPSNWNTLDSSGMKGHDETPQSTAREGSSVASGKRVYYSCGSRREYYDATSFSNTQLLLEIWKELLKRSTSTSCVSKAEAVLAESNGSQQKTHALMS